MTLENSLRIIFEKASEPRVDRPPLVPPKLYLNGFPKAGLHLAERMAYAMLQPVRQAYNWFGTNAWETERHNLDRAATNFGAIQAGRFLKGHTGYLQALESLMRGLGVGLVFVYRDLRDVVVSHAYHIMRADGINTFHPAQDEYRALGGKEQIMLAVIEGIPGFEGIFERWSTYAPWLERDWVLPLSFENMIRTPERAAGEFFDYLYGLSLAASGYAEGYLDKELRAATIAGMLYEMRHTDRSPTFRKGTTKQWRFEFTPAVTARFKELDPGWLVKLGYEKDNSWQSWV